MHSKSVNLGHAGDFAILAKAGVSTVPQSYIKGDVGCSPIAIEALTGFSLVASSSGVFCTSTQVQGKCYGANSVSPTPAKLTQAVSDMEAAYTSANSQAPDNTELSAGDVSGMTLQAGVYKWGTGLLINKDLMLQGDANAVFVFQIAKGLTMGSGAKVLLSGGVRACNIFWAVAEASTLGTTSHLEGVLLSYTSVAMLTGASINGRLLAQTAVTLQMNEVNSL